MLLVAALGRPPARDSLAARRLWLAALDAEARLQQDSALALLGRARDAAPSFFPAQFEYLRLRWGRGEYAEARAEYSRPGAAGGTLAECLAIVSALRASQVFTPAAQWPLVTRLRLLEPVDSSGCASSFLLEFIPPPARDSGYTDAVRRGKRAVALAPGIPDVATSLANVFARGGDTAAAVGVLRAAMREAPHPLLGALAGSALASQLEGQGEAAAADQLVLVLSRAAARSGLPGLRLLAATAGGSSLPKLDLAIAIATAAGDRRTRATQLMFFGKFATDVGTPARGVARLDTAVALADSLGIPQLQLQARLWRGRAETKVGSRRAAEQDLQAAVRFGALAPVVYYLAESWHNLAHLYESEGRWTQAARAADRFVACARPLRYDPLRMMSLHDAGTIRWEAGWHAAADRDFREMVQVIDEQRNADDYTWAGEYLERRGALAQALDYFRRGVAGQPREPRNYVGLARVSEALGHDDEARRAASIHDSLVDRWTPTDAPLLPALLARQGRRVEAVATAGAWVTRQLRGGNLEGASLAAVEVGDLALAAGQPAAALDAARRADSLAGLLHEVAVKERAETIRGRALVALGNPAPGLEALQRAAMLAARHPTTDGVVEAQSALGEALAAAGRPAAALEAFDLAARPVERVTAGLPEEVDRANYRARHLRPFDQALRLLLSARPSDPAATVAWSERRKAAAMMLATGRSTSGAVPLPLLERRLGPGEALVDYTLSDAGPAAVVVTRDRATVIRMTVPTDSIAALAARLSAPFGTTYGGRLDLAHARFDLDAAARLYQVLIAPLRPALAGATRLIISPDGALCGLPFAALVSVTPASGDPDAYLTARYLLDDFELAYTPAPQFLASVRHTARLTGARVLFFVGQTPGSDAEVAAVSGAWPAGRITVLSGQEASEAAARRAVPRYAVLHFATHAEASSDDPLASHLILAAGGREDGYFHLEEIAAAHLAAPLVVLSACATLAGRISTGEGMLGLAWAFLLGGAHNVLATRWPIGAATAGMMGIFYRRLAAGEPPEAALRAAQLRLRSDRKTAQPFFWAGFTMVQRGAPGS